MKVYQYLNVDFSGYCPWGDNVSDMTEYTHTHTHTLTVSLHAVHLPEDQESYVTQGIQKGTVSQMPGRG